LPGIRWDGRPLQGETVLVWGEQRLADMLEFVRYVPSIEQQGGRPVLWTPRALMPLLQTSGFRELVPADEPPPACDFECEVASLPHVFGTTLETVPNRVPYLAADPRLTSQWQARLGGAGGLRIGVCWRGNRANPLERARSIPFEQLSALAVPGVRLMGLQPSGADEAAGAPAAFESSGLDDIYGAADDALANAAAVIRNLDLVITTDTPLAHLAGALAVPVWVALEIVPDWRWMLERRDSPWYPSMRLFRQQRAGRWADVLQEMAAALRAEVAARAGV
jgi:hypothetical protein